MVAHEIVGRKRHSSNQTLGFSGCSAKLTLRSSISLHFSILHHAAGIVTEAEKQSIPYTRKSLRVSSSAPIYKDNYQKSDVAF